MLNFKKKPIVLNCYTPLSWVYESTPIMESKKFLPDFYKKLPKYKDINPPFDGSSMNMRGCYGFTRYFAKGFMLPMWSDMAVSTRNNELIVSFADPKTGIERHNPQQFNHWGVGETHHAKIVSPWAFTCDEKIDFYWAEAGWNMKSPLDYTVLSGILNFKDQHSTNINMMISSATDKDFMIEYGTPLVHLVPITDREVVVKNHLVSIDDFDHISHSKATASFLNSMLKSAKLRKTRSCPFSAN